MLLRQHLYNIDNVFSPCPHTTKHTTVILGKHEGFTNHMACTDTGLKTCDRPAVFTLKPLVRKRRRRKISLSLDGDEE